MLAEASFFFDGYNEAADQSDICKNRRLATKLKTNLQSTDKLRVRALYGSFGSELCVNGIDKMSGHTICVC